jgi:hypothetical protein
MNYITKFNDWVASVLPGLKTKIVAGLGSLGMLGAYAQEYVSGIHLDQFISSKTTALISAGMFTLAYWFRGLADKK